VLLPKQKCESIPCEQTQDQLAIQSLSNEAGSMNFGCTPLAGFMGKREPQTILKTDERAIRLKLGCEGNSPPNQAVGTKAGFSFRAIS
jgi:hypothetical protein